MESILWCLHSWEHTASTPETPTGWRFQYIDGMCDGDLIARQWILHFVKNLGVCIDTPMLFRKPSCNYYYWKLLTESTASLFPAAPYTQTTSSTRYTSWQYSTIRGWGSTMPNCCEPFEVSYLVNHKIHIGDGLCLHGTLRDWCSLCDIPSRVFRHTYDSGWTILNLARFLGKQPHKSNCTHILLEFCYADFSEMITTTPNWVTLKTSSLKSAP